MDDYMRTIFPQRLKALREVIGASQEEMAAKLGVARQSISLYEKGNRLPDIQVLDAICQATGCDPEYLLGYQDEMNGRFADRTDSLTLDEETLALLERQAGVPGLNELLKLSSFWMLSKTVHNYIVAALEPPGNKDGRPYKYNKFICHEALDEVLSDALDVKFSELTEDERRDLVDKREKWVQESEEQVSQTLEQYHAFREEERQQAEQHSEEFNAFREEEMRINVEKMKTDKFLRFQARLNNWPEWQRFNKQGGNDDAPQAD